MASEEEFERTQILYSSFNKSVDAIVSPEKLQVATLSINGEEYPIFNGDTKIGRDAKQCAVAIDRKSVSSHHALIEVESGLHLMCDLGSSNSTRLGGKLLKPHRRYNLIDGAIIQIADLQGTYNILPKKPEFNTSTRDIFESPSCSKEKTPQRLSLNVSEDNSIIESSLLLRKELKQPFPNRRSSTLNDSIYLQSTICGSPNYSFYEAETQIGLGLENESRNSSVILSETLYESQAVSEKAASSFVVPHTQDQHSESSLMLHFDTDRSVNETNSKSICSTDSIDSAKKNESNIVCEGVLPCNEEKRPMFNPNCSEATKGNVNSGKYELIPPSENVAVTSSDDSIVTQSQNRRRRKVKKKETSIPLRRSPRLQDMASKGSAPKVTQPSLQKPKSVRKLKVAQKQK